MKLSIEARSTAHQFQYENQDIQCVVDSFFRGIALEAITDDIPGYVYGELDNEAKYEVHRRLAARIMAIAEMAKQGKSDWIC